MKWKEKSFVSLMKYSMRFIYKFHVIVAAFPALDFFFMKRIKYEVHEYFICRPQNGKKELFAHYCFLLFRIIFFLFLKSIIATSHLRWRCKTLYACFQQLFEHRNNEKKERRRMNSFGVLSEKGHNAYSNG